MSTNVLSPMPRMDLSDAVGDAEAAIRFYDLAVVTHSEAVDRLTALEQARAAEKIAALVRVCATTHPATGKNYSASQAEDLLQLDPAYAEYRRRVVEATSAAREAEDEKTSARLVAQLRIAAVRGTVTP